jgi:HEAT repeat protein
MQFAIRHFPLCALCLLILAAPGLAAPALDQIPALAGTLGGTDPAARNEAAARIRAMGLPAMAGLAATMRTGSAAERRGAALGLGLLPAPELAGDALLAALADPDMAVRSMAAHAAAMAGPPLAPRLVGLLNDPDARTRDAAAYALSLMGARSVPALAHGLTAADPFARSKAAWMLGHMGDAALPAVPALVRALDIDDPRVVHVVAEAIDLIGPQPALVWHHLMLLGARPTGFPLARMGTGAAPVLVRLLDRPGTPLAQTAFRALMAIGPEAAPALRRAVETGTPSQRTGAALLLSDIDPDSVLTLPDDLRLSLSGARHDQ